MSYCGTLFLGFSLGGTCGHLWVPLVVMRDPVVMWIKCEGNIGYNLELGFIELVTSYNLREPHFHSIGLDRYLGTEYVPFCFSLGYEQFSFI
jgi:hypothetical protein